MPIDLARASATLSRVPPEDPSTLARAQSLLEGPDGRALARHLRDTDDRTLDEQLRLARTPAPPFQEERRGALMAELLRESGTSTPAVDEVGNVVSWFGPPGPRPVVLTAHLDTVFPAGEPIEIRREGDVWTGPGICDDARGLAALLALLRGLDAVGARLPYPLRVAATVGEEGAGDLRGVRHLLGPSGAAADARAFLSLDGAGVQRIVASGVGSRRYRATVEGPGGHSWVNAGRVNPIRIVARALARLDQARVPEGTTLNVGRIHGGTSVNAIPTKVWVELEARSEDAGELAAASRLLLRLLDEALEESNRHGPEAGVATLDVETIGDRPAGRCDPATDLCRAAVAATTAVAQRAELAASSTDANYAMSLGIPALTLGAGGEAGEAHTPREWYRNANGPEGVLRAALTLLTLGEMEGV